VAAPFDVQIRRWLRTSPVAGVQAAKNAYLLDVGQFIRGQWRAGVRKKTRRLRDSIVRSGLEPSETAKTVSVRVYSRLPEQARWDSEGTGLYGPRRQLIRPKRARVLAWPAAGAGRKGGMVFARFVRGKRGTHAYQNATDGAETRAYQEERRAELDRAIRAALDRSIT